MTNSNSAVARAIYDAYVAKDRDAAERLLAADFSFTSPLDNRLDRDSYFAICWSNSADAVGFQIVHVAEYGEQVFVTYEGKGKQSSFRNTEILTVRDGQIAQIETYFGWNLPHEVPAGEHRDPADDRHRSPIPRGDPGGQGSGTPALGRAFLRGRHAHPGLGVDEELPAQGGGDRRRAPGRR